MSLFSYFLFLLSSFFFAAFLLSSNLIDSDIDINAFALVFRAYFALYCCCYWWRLRLQWFLLILVVADKFLLVAAATTTTTAVANARLTKSQKARKKTKANKNFPQGSNTP